MAIAVTSNRARAAERATLNGMQRTIFDDTVFNACH